MKKSALAVLYLVLAILLIAGVFANNHTLSTNASNNDSKTTSISTSNAPGSSTSDNAGVEKGYQCLESQTKDKTASQLSLQDAIFSTLALGSRANLQSKIDSEKKPGESCWPKAACTIKETAQVMLAHDRSGKNAKDIESWIISKNSTSGDLIWYIEVDIQNHQQAECTLTYDGSQRKINILNDMKIEGNPGNCFSISGSGYWLTARENCFNKEIQISCNQDFITAQIYEKKAGSGTLYVSSTTKSAAALGSTTEKIDSRCFKSGNACDYEGTLWAALALHKAGKNIDAYVPYLLALAENNQKYFPSAFIYSIIGGEDQYTQIIQQQKQGRSWKIIGSPYNEFYDTSLGMLALGSSSASLGELESTKNYLLSIQGKDGCWNNNNIRDTAFILYSGWSKAGTLASPGTGSTLCEQVSGQSCEIANECIDSGGRILSNFQCSGGSVCCSQAVNKPSCREQRGIICSLSQICDGRAVQASDSGICCLDACIEEETENTCEIFGGTCKSSCEDDEETDEANTCSSENQVCCIAKEKKKGSIWIWILLILILLLIIAILFRNKLRVWWYKYKGKAKITPVTRPPGSSGMSFGLEPERFRPRLPVGIPGRPASSPVRKPVSGGDKEMEETLRKLKEISK